MKNLIVILFIVISSNLFAQEEEKVRRLDPNIFFGGNLGAVFGDITNVDVSPFIGYRLFDQQLGLGIGGTFQYFADNRVDFETTVYGGRVFAQFLPERLDMILIHAEYEMLNYELPGLIDGGRVRAWIYNPLIGGGLRLGNATIMALWNLNGNSIFANNPMMRIGYMF